jgi:hypothetical protein
MTLKQLTALQISKLGFEPKELSDMAFTMADAGDFEAYAKLMLAYCLQVIQ